jgi:hypothetical protein
MLIPDPADALVCSLSNSAILCKARIPPGYIGVWTKSLARRTLRHGLWAGIVGYVSLGSQEVYRDPSSAAHAG